MRLIYIFIFLLFPSIALAETYYYVDDEASGTNAGTSWENAWESFTDIAWATVTTALSSDNVTVCLKKDRTFNEGLILGSTGTSSYTLTIGIHPDDTGARPIITNSSGTGISSLERDYVVFDNLEILNCSADGISAYVSSLTAWADVECDHITVQNCKITGSATNGIYICGHYATIENCELDDNGDSSAYHNIYLIGSNGLIEHNTIARSAQGNGIRYEGADSIFRYNWVEDNHKHGISYSNDFPDDFSGNQCYSNVIICTDFNDTPVTDPCAISITIQSTGQFTGIEIYNNTIYGYDNETANNISGIVSWSAASTNVKIKNNIIWASDYAIGIQGATTGFEATNNCIYDYTAFYWNDGSQSFSEWQLAGRGVDSNNGDPLFTSSVGGDFSIQSGSPCKDTGSNAVWSGTADIDDYKGHTITDGSGAIAVYGGTVDKGAIEYGMFLSIISSGQIAFEGNQLILE
jgi:hypothetical protein